MIENELQKEIEQLRQEINKLHKEVDLLKQNPVLTYSQKTVLGQALLNEKSKTATQGVYFVAETSAGSPTRKLTFNDGILISDTN